MLEKVKLALRLTTDAFDDELNDLIAAALLDLGIAGIVIPTVPVTTEEESEMDPLIIRAVTTYCKLNFGVPADGQYDRLKAAYDEQKGQLAIATGYTNWGTEE